MLVIDSRNGTRIKVMYNYHFMLLPRSVTEVMQVVFLLESRGEKGRYCNHHAVKKWLPRFRKMATHVCSSTRAILICVLCRSKRWESHVCFCWLVGALLCWFCILHHHQSSISHQWKSWFMMLHWWWWWWWKTNNYIPVLHSQLTTTHSTSLLLSD